MVCPQWVSSVALTYSPFLQSLVVECSCKLSNALHPLLVPLSITACSMLVCMVPNVACLREMYPQIVLTTSSCHCWRHLLLPRHIMHGKDYICHGQQDYQRIVDGWRKSSEPSPHPRSNKCPWLTALIKGETHPYQHFHEMPMSGTLPHLQLSHNKCQM